MIKCVGMEAHFSLYKHQMTVWCPLGENSCILAEQQDKLDVFILNCLVMDSSVIPTEGQQRAANAPSRPVTAG